MSRVRRLAHSRTDLAADVFPRRGGDRAHSVRRILAVPLKVSQRLLLVGDIFRGRAHVALDLGQVPLNRCAVHPAV
jgi:hypothetical protein